MGGSAFGSFFGDNNGQLASMMQKPGLGGGSPTFGGGKNPLMPPRGRPIDSPNYGGGMANDHGPSWNKGPMGVHGAPDIGMMPGRGNEGMIPANPGMGMAGQREPWAMGGGMGPNAHGPAWNKGPMGGGMGMNRPGTPNREPWAMGGGGMTAGGQFPAYNPMPVGGRPMGRGGILGSWR